MTMIATEKQMNFIGKLLNERLDNEVSAADKQIVKAICQVLGDDTVEVNKSAASQFIDMLLKITVQHSPKQVNVINDEHNARIPLGTYTIVLNGDENDYVTLKVDNAPWAGENKITVSYLAGSDNECSYKGFAFVGYNGIKVWQLFQSNTRIVEAAEILWAISQTQAGLGAAHEEFLKKAEAYAMVSGRCMRCHHVLTVPASLHRGLGPECAKKENI